MALTRTPNGETSRANDFVKPITPALAAAYAAAGRMEPYSPAVEAKLTIAPERTSSIAGSTARQATSAVSRLVEIISAQSVGEEPTKSPNLKVPATFTNTSGRPKTSVASATSRENSPKSAASAARPQTVPAVPSNSSMSVPRGAALTSVSATWAPWATNTRL